MNATDIIPAAEQTAILDAFGFVQFAELGAVRYFGDGETTAQISDGMTAAELASQCSMPVATILGYCES